MTRRKKDVMAAGADSDQDEEVEELFGGGDTTKNGTTEGVKTDFSRAATMAAQDGL